MTQHSWIRRHLGAVAIAAVVAFIMLIALITLVTTSTSTNSKAQAQEIELTASSSDILDAVVGSLGSSNGEVTPDPVINPRANLVVACDGSGEVEFDNRDSTVELGFELVMGTIVTTHAVEAGHTLVVGFSGVPAGTEVAAQTGEGVPYAMMTVPTECPVNTAH